VPGYIIIVKDEELSKLKKSGGYTPWFIVRYVMSQHGVEKIRKGVYLAPTREGAREISRAFGDLVRIFEVTEEVTDQILGGEEEG